MLALVQVPAATTAATVGGYEEESGGPWISQNNSNQPRGDILLENIRALLAVPDDYTPSPGLPCRLALLCSLSLCLLTCTLMRVPFPFFPADFAAFYCPPPLACYDSPLRKISSCVLLRPPPYIHSCAPCPQLLCFKGVVPPDLLRLQLVGSRKTPRTASRRLNSSPLTLLCRFRRPPIG